MRHAIRIFNSSKLTSIFYDAAIPLIYTQASFFAWPFHTSDTPTKTAENGSVKLEKNVSSTPHISFNMNNNNKVNNNNNSETSTKINTVINYKNNNIIAPNSDSNNGHCTHQQQPIHQPITHSIPALEEIENKQRELEALVDARKVIFATGISAEKSARAAAREAFDIARAALPRPPNFCIVNVSLDLETMIDVPEVVWALLRDSGKKAGLKPKMIGSAVSMQRFGTQAGFVQLTLGCVPDLELDVFTLDAIPSADYLGRKNAPQAVAVYVALDANLVVKYSSSINIQMSKLKKSLAQVVAHANLEKKVDENENVQKAVNAPPFFGAVLPLVGRYDTGKTHRQHECDGNNKNSEIIKNKRATIPTTAHSTDASTHEKNDHNSDNSEEVVSSNDSVAFFNDQVFKGSATCCIIRSNMLDCHTCGVIPSIELIKGVVTDLVAFQSEFLSDTSAREEDELRDREMKVGGPSTFVIKTIDNVPSAEYIKNIYGTQLKTNDFSKVFLGISYEGSMVSLPFTGDDVAGTIIVTLPAFLPLLKKGTEVHFVCNDVELDIEYCAGVLLKCIEAKPFVAVEKSVATRNEVSRIRFITASTCMGMHFSYPLMNQLAERTDVMALMHAGREQRLVVPPVMARCLGRQATTGGMYCSAQVIEVAGHPLVLPRSSNNIVLFGKE